MARTDHLIKAALLLAVAVFLGAMLRPGDSAAPLPGQRVPQFDLAADDGSRVRLSDYQGKILVVNFWATWCPPCVAEMPSLDRFQQMFAARGVEVLAISVDDDESAYRSFLAQHNVRLRTVRDPEKKVSALYGTFKYPESYIVDREGRLVRKIVGPADWMSESMVSVFQDLVGK